MTGGLYVCSERRQDHEQTYGRSRALCALRDEEVFVGGID